MVNRKLMLLIIILLIIALIISFIGVDFLQFINSNLITIKSFVEIYPVQSKIIFFLSYIFMTSLSLPVAFLLGLLSGMLFDLIEAVILVSLASTLGALFAFLISKYLFQAYFSKKYHQAFKKINDGFIKNGALYLFAIRMCMIFPYFIVNTLTGLTSINTLTYFIITMLGMLPSTIIVIMIGSKLDQYLVVGGGIDLEIIILLTLLGVLPLLSKLIFNRLFNTDILK